MAKRGELPDLIFVGPIGGGKVKARHTHVAFVVEEWDELGRPMRLRLCKEDEEYQVEEFTAADGEFITGYIQSQMLFEHVEKRNKRMKDTDAGRRRKKGT